MSIFETIKGAIFVEEGSKTPPATVPAPSAAAPNTGGQAASNIVPENTEQINAIRAATLNRKTAYTALIDAADKLKSVIPDANTRIKAAYAMVGGEQRTAEAIISAIGIHLTDVEAEQRRLATQLEASTTAQVTNLQKQAAELTAANADRLRHIESIQEQINTTTKDIAELTATAASNQQKLEAGGAQCARSIQVVRSELESQRTLLTTLLS